MRWARCAGGEEGWWLRRFCALSGHLALPAPWCVPQARNSPNSVQKFYEGSVIETHCLNHWQLVINSLSRFPPFPRGWKVGLKSCLGCSGDESLSWNYLSTLSHLSPHSIQKDTHHPQDSKSLRSSCVRNQGLRPSMRTKDATTAPSLRKLPIQGFRSSVPGTGDKDQIYIHLLHHTITLMYSPHSWMPRDLNSLAEFWFLTVPGSVLFLIRHISLSFSVLPWLTHPKPHLFIGYWIYSMWHLKFI